MNIRKAITSEIEWNTIKKAQADGKLQELLQVGDELDITLKTGEELTVQAVGTTERGLIFLLKDCMKDEHGMNKRMTNKGDWRDSASGWWERSPYGSDSTYFCGVGSGGDAAYDVASGARGVAFGFCL